MEPFEYYLKKGFVRKISPNIWRAGFLIKDAESRLKDLKKISLEKFPKIFFENMYDVIRNFCDAILFADGYKSYSHEASITYLTKKGFDIATVGKLDSLRYRRNGSKYYGEPIYVEDAKDIRGFYLKIEKKLKTLLRDLNRK